MKKLRILSLLLALVTVITMFAGCGKKDEEKDDNKPADSVSEQADAGQNNSANGNADANTPISYNGLPASFTVTKIGTSAHDGGYYQDLNTRKYGIVSADGSHDTGAIYYKCTPVFNGKYYIVTTTEQPQNSTNGSDFNLEGLVDEFGNVIIPTEYFTLDVLNERFAKVTQATERTFNEDECLVYLHVGQDIVILGDIDEEDLMYKGNWYIIDIQTGMKVPGASGTSVFNAYAKGDYITIETRENGNYIEKTINYAGQPLPEDATLFSNGCYALLNGNIGSVYATNGTKMFDYDPYGYVPYTSEGDYFLARKTVNNATKYVIMDESGSIVSAELADAPYIIKGEVYNDWDGNFFNLNGTRFVSGQFSTSFYVEEWFGNNVYILRDSEKDIYLMYDSNGNLLCSEEGLDDAYFDTSNFTAFNKIGDQYYYYSHKDNGFTIIGKGYSLPFMVKSPSGASCNLVSSITGETLITGYDDYTYAGSFSDTLYVYAKKADGTYDVYTVR